ncbi:DUF6270 domain-containing protein [Pseudarthrobacter sp. PS3-L1]|uniref:DUF6270 domain-containing protein n=1 Tax=Pseudarthrobacter sp. PS3-L1 TaxID=3046207 RepID=UPI0024BA1866|nr:DUF6270 domain-containing protein [Pseudarthrobacter sp. PS3-L1]MDJ0321747.1 DUF6270 domain-containing protein [Pseudarthrobacter sp. PS3-L1]
MDSINVFTYGSGPAKQLAANYPDLRLKSVGSVERQSLISAMSGVASVQQDLIRNSSGAASRNLFGDITGSLKKSISEIRSKTDYLLFDLFDERFGVDLLTTGGYITRTPERLQQIDTNVEVQRTLKFGTAAHFEIWKTAARWFINELEKSSLLDLTILLDVSWASEDENAKSVELAFGDSSDTANRNFKKYTDYICSLGIKRIKLSETLAASDHPWGRAPYNFHESVYKVLGQKFFNVLQVQKSNSPKFASWDFRYDSPIQYWNSIEDTSFLPKTRTHNIIRPKSPDESLSLEFLLITNPSDTLVVVSHGAQTRPKHVIPRFESFATLREREENIMFLADTALEIDDKLNLAWFTGTESDDLTLRYSRLIENTVNKLHIKKLLFVGGSGGGFASLRLSSLVPNSRALAFNPQTDILRYWRSAVESYRHALYPETSSLQALETLGARVKITGHLANDHTRQAIIVQNDDDPHHIQRHLTPYIKPLGLAPVSGNSKDGNTRIVVDHFASGHNMPYRLVMNPFIDSALESWGQNLSEIVIPPAATLGISEEPAVTEIGPEKAPVSMIWLDVIICDAETDNRIVSSYIDRFRTSVAGLSAQKDINKTDVIFTVHLSRDKKQFIEAINEIMAQLPKLERWKSQIHFYDHPVEGYGELASSHPDLRVNPNKQPGRRELLFEDASLGFSFEKYDYVIRISMDDDDFFLPNHLNQVKAIADQLYLQNPEQVSAAGLYRSYIVSSNPDRATAEFVDFRRVIPGNKFFIIPSQSIDEISQFSPWSIPERIDEESVERFSRRRIRLNLIRDNQPTFAYMRRQSNLSGQSKDHSIDKRYEGFAAEGEAALLRTLIEKDLSKSISKAYTSKPLSRVFVVNLRRIDLQSVRVSSNFSRVYDDSHKIAYVLLRGSTQLETKWYSHSDVVEFKTQKRGLTVRAMVRRNGVVVSRAKSKDVS